MQIIQQIIFIALVLFAIWFFTRNIKKIRRNILLGRDDEVPGEQTAHHDLRSRRWKNVLLLALGQKKMFRNPLVAVLHFFIYAGFIVINIEVLEIVLDGGLGSHRLFAHALGGFYTFLIDAFEILAVLVLLACIIFLARRNILKLNRFISHDLDGWPRSDANYILITEIILMLLFLTMNTTDRALQIRGYENYHNVGSFLISGFLSSRLPSASSSTLMAAERTCWWLHISGIFAFLNYLPYSKHLHILFAFPNAYYARLQPKGEMNNMPAVQAEVLYALKPETIPAETTATINSANARFGARDVFDLNWRNLLDAYSCTECGRCTAACPANITGKILSPRKIIMDTRDRLEEVGRNIDENGEFKDDGKNLFSYISIEELRACTTCNACVEECPVSISPLEIILELRRSLIMEDSNAPQEWNAMFSNIENNFAPWKFSPDDRDKWAREV